MGGISRIGKGNELDIWRSAKPAVQYDLLEVWSLARLRRVVRLRREQSELLSSEGLHLLDWAIYSLFCDCVGLGLRAEARAIVGPGPKTRAE